MANHKSAVKRAKQSEVRRVNNKSKTSRVKTEVKKLRTAIETKDKTTAQKLFVTVQSLLNKLAKSSAVDKKTASRKTSRLASQVSAL